MAGRWLLACLPARRLPNVTDLNSAATVVALPLQLPVFLLTSLLSSRVFSYVCAHLFECLG